MEKLILIVVAIVGILGLSFGLSLLMAYPLMIAWNYVVPYLFSLKTISFWQSFALMFVCSLLIKSSNTNNNK